MVPLAKVVRRHAAKYIGRFRASMLPSHLRALRAIVYCRTPALGGHLAACMRCDGRHVVYHSCRHRACPSCGRDAAERWLSRQRELLLPVPHFHVVFTLPAELRRIVRSHQKVLLPVLFRAAYYALAKLCRDPRYLGGQIGALAVLHTWTRTLAYHPHVHMLVPGGALAPDGTWRTVPRRKKLYLVPVRAVAKIFRQKFLQEARRALPDVKLPFIPKKKSWIVFAKPVVQGADTILKYLGRYVHRTAIGNGAIIACDDETVTFRYRDSRTHQSKRMTLPAEEFLRRFLQHVLPKGMHRVRCYGLLHPAHRFTLNRLQLMLDMPQPACPPEPAASTAAGSPLRCPSCGTASLLLVRYLSPEECFARLDVNPTLTVARAPPPMALAAFP